MNQQLVRQFHEKFKFEVGVAKVDGPYDDAIAYATSEFTDRAITLRQIVGYDLRVRRLSLILEEVGELAEALRERDRVLLADALADLAYVVYGTAVSYGIPLDRCVAEVHRSNMTKDVGSFKPTKGPGYSPPDLVRFAFQVDEEGATP